MIDIKNPRPEELIEEGFILVPNWRQIRATVHSKDFKIIERYYDDPSQPLRTKEQKSIHILSGKMGEEGFCTMYSSVTDVSYESGPDPGWDVKTEDGHKIDVKSISSLIYRKVFIKNLKLEDNVYYAIIYAIESEGKYFCKMIGIKSAQKLKKSDNSGWFSLRLFEDKKDIDYTLANNLENIELFI